MALALCQAKFSFDLHGLLPYWWAEKRNSAGFLPTSWTHTDKALHVTRLFNFCEVFSGWGIPSSAPTTLRDLMAMDLGTVTRYWHHTSEVLEPP